MDDNENKKTHEELADEALGQVVGGMSDEGMFSTNPRCCNCGRDHVPLGGGSTLTRRVIQNPFPASARIA